MLDAIRSFIGGLRLYNYAPDKIPMSELIVPVYIPATVPAPMRSPVSAKDVFEIPEQTAQWKGIVLHHSATQDNPAGNDTESIRRYHMSFRVDGNSVTEAEYNAASRKGRSHCEKAWSQIGYHILIERAGGAPEVKMGRSWLKAGAHAGFLGNNSFNEKYLGLCIIGSYNAAPPDAETWALTVAVVRQIMARFGFDASHVLGHRETYDIVGVPRAKTCPGTMFSLDKLRSDIS